MVRARRAVRRPKAKKAEQYDSDDPATYRDMPVPDKKSSEYVEDEIEQFHNKRISNLLARGIQADSDQEDIEDEEEVMALDDSEEDEEEQEVGEDGEEEEETDMESDLEGRKEDDLPSDMAWGRRKKMYYDSDYVAVKGKSKEEVDAEDQEEEEEAKNIQKRLVGSLSEDDYDLHLLQELGGEGEGEVERSLEKEKQKIVKDLKQMSHKEKVKLLKKESPELLELIQDFKAKLTELRDELQPLLKMVKDGHIPAGKGAEYLKTKQQLYLNYCTNVSFYLVLKSKRIPAHSHPVIERLVSYRNLINELSPVDARLAPQLRRLLSETQQGTAVRTTDAPRRKGPGDSESEAEEDSDSELDEQAALRAYREIERRQKLKRTAKKLQPDEAEEEEEKEEESDLDPDAKRGITYQMDKNKGLTPKRKKIDRNPRVKYREKFRKAKIRRKGQVREVRKEEVQYGGELSGIRAGVKKSVKLK
ncbi:something about silencing protein 10 [Brienomyrus brachyistius]|uniref:something about silencing protein 10 n=1 Tax=Brienomyrus brachyistius TaxID=42636 RepID=UPI0020B1B228|nr:something about silencing protein 10 [Brienomyrus brachyistius]